MVELASPSDEGPRGVTALRRKMERYRRNGTQLCLLLLPAEQAVELWRAGAAEFERLAPAETLSAEPQFSGLVLDLADVWQG